MSSEARLQLDDLWLGRESQIFAVLAVTPDNAFAADLRRIVRPLAGRKQVVLATAGSVPAAFDRLESETFDLSLLDLDLGEKALLQWMKGVTTRRESLPVILLATPEQEDLTVRGMVAGASDYLFKGSLSPELLLRSMHYTLEVQRLSTDLTVSRNAARRFFDRSPIGGFKVDPEGRLIDCNTAFLAILGYPDRSEVLSQRALALYYSDRTVAGGAGWLAEGSPLTDRRVCLATADGEPVWVALRARRVPGGPGQEPVIEGTLIDLTDLERVRERLQTLRKDVQTLLDTSREGILWLDASGRIQGCNRAAESYLGHLASDLDGREPAEAPLLALYPPIDPQREAVADSLEDPSPAEVSFRLKEGNRERFRLVESPLDEEPKSGAAGRFLVFRPVGSGTDHAPSRRLETLGRLAGGVVHDFKNQLTSILGYADLLLLDLEPGERGWDNAAELRDAVIRSRTLAGELLALGRDEQEAHTRLDLNRALADQARVLERITGPRVAFDLVLGPAKLLLRLNPEHLERIVTNLVSNARDARPSEGRVRVSADREDIDRPIATDWGELPPGSYARLTVRDTGTGMEPEIKARMFEPFFTTKPPGEGTGLGLSTVADLVGQSGGAIDVASRPGSGTTVRVWLPLAGGST